MILSVLFYGAAGLFILLILSGIFMAVQRKGKEKRKKADEGATIYASGVYSLIRKSPRQEVVDRIPALEEIENALRDGGSAPSPGAMAEPAPPAKAASREAAAAYRADWQRLAELSISNVERGDRDGVQTYRYQVPPKCRACCGMFGGDAYVTREQLHNHPRLIPPFHLGCGVILVTKDAYNPGVENVGWTPILPVNGKYITPDWRTVVNL